MKKYYTYLFIFVLLSLFMDDESKKRNRMYQRYNPTQIEELIITINHLQKPIGD